MSEQNQAQFDAMLTVLLSANDAERNSAEQALRTLDTPQNADQLAVFLINAIKNATLPKESRQMACSLLHRRVRRRDEESTDNDDNNGSTDGTTTSTPATTSSSNNNNNLYDLCSGGVKEFMKRELVSAYEQERDRAVQMKLAEVLADLSGLLSAGQRGGWAELLPFVFRLTKSADAGQREGAMVLFSELGVELGAEVFRPFFDVIEQILEAGMKDAGSFDVRLAALEATAVFLAIMREEDARTVRKFGSLLPAMLECITVALQNGREEEAQSAIKNFIDVAEMQPSFFLPHLGVVTQTMFAVMNHEGLSVETRGIALEMLVSLCGYRPGSMKKVPGFVDTVVDILLRWLTTCEDYPEWADFEDPDPDTLAAYAEDALDRLALALHGKTIVPALFGRINFLVANPDWRFRNAAMNAITVSTEGCKTALRSHVQETLMSVIGVTKDANMRVRWSAINCVSQLCTDFGPQIQRHHGQAIVDTLCAGMTDPVPRVAAIAAIAVVNFVTDASPDVVIKHSTQLFTSLQRLFASSVVKVQEAAITATTALLDVARATFEPFYDAYVPYLKTILRNAKQKEYRLIRGKAMECLTFAGIAVGKQRFAADALEVLNEMLATKLDADDPQIAYLQSAFGTLSECLGSDFVPFLPTVLPPTLALATQKAEVEIAGESVPDGWETVELSDHTLAIHTAALEDKASAIHILSVYASNLGVGFLPYVEQCLTIALANIDFPYHDMVRGNAYMLLSYLLHNLAAAVKGGAAPAARLLEAFQAAVHSVCRALPKEDDGAVVVQGSQALESIVRATEGVEVPADALAQVARCCNTMTRKWAENQRRLDKERTVEDFDDEVAESAEEADMLVSLIMENFGDVVAACFKVAGERFTPVFARDMLPAVLERLAPAWGWRVVHKSLCILCDAAEFSVAFARQHGLAGLAVCETYLASDIPEMRQAAYYYLGVASVSMGADLFGPKAGPVLAALRAGIADTRGRARQDFDAWAPVYDNAVAAFLKVVHAYVGTLPLGDTAELLAFLLQALPFTCDQEEARKCYTLFFTLLERFPAETLGGPACSNAPALVAVVADMVDNAFSEPNDAARISAILKKVLSALPPQVVSALPPQQVSSIHSFVSKF